MAQAAQYGRTKVPAFRVHGGVASMGPVVHVVKQPTLQVVKTKAPAKAKAPKPIKIPRGPQALAHKLVHGSTHDIQLMAYHLTSKALGAKSLSSKQKLTAQAAAAHHAAATRAKQHNHVQTRVATHAASTTKRTSTAKTTKAAKPKTTPSTTVNPATQGLTGAFAQAAANATTPQMPTWYQQIINADNAQTTQQANAIKQIYTDNYNRLVSLGQTAGGEYSDLAKASGMAWSPGAGLPGQPDISQIMNSDNAAISGANGVIPLQGINTTAGELVKSEPFALQSLYGANTAAQEKLAATYGTEIMKAMATGNTAALNAIERLIANQNTNSTNAANNAANNATKVAVANIKGSGSGSSGSAAAGRQASSQHNTQYNNAIKAIGTFVHGGTGSGAHGHWVNSTDPVTGNTTSVWQPDPNAATTHGLHGVDLAQGILGQLKQYNLLTPNDQFKIISSYITGADLNTFLYNNRSTPVGQSSFALKVMARARAIAAKYKKITSTAQVKALGAALYPLVGNQGAHDLISHIPGGAAMYAAAAAGH